MYSFEYCSRLNIGSKVDMTLNVYFDGQLVDSRVVQFNSNVTQIELDNFANSVIDTIEGFE